MRAAAISLALCLPAIALAGTPVAPVIGGSNAPQGTWPATGAILYGSASDPAASNSDPAMSFECTGVLVAPTVVLTAGHCVPGVDNDGGYIGDLTGVVLGTASLDDVASGELIVAQNSDITEYPNSQTSVDIGIIKLETPAKETPAPIATGWARLDITNGANVEFVGFGSIDKDGNDYIPQEQEAESTITDFDCSTSSGCNSAAMPDGELGAGGMGIDTCPGDSGGGMYLLTTYGQFVAGITSRGYDSDTFACSQGGIYGRPDKIVDYIEMTTGVKVARGPEPSADPITIVPGGPAQTTITANDPKSNDHDYSITTQPMNGMAAVNDDGVVRVCENPTATAPDSVVVTVTDSNDSTRAIPLTIPIAVTSGDAPSMCDVDAFSGGCCDAGGSPSGSIAIALVVGIALVRGRRRS